ncbi:MAG: virulence RhuM family protein [Campylobacterota bacterium]
MMVNESSNIIIYSSEDGTTKLEVKLENETLWLSQKQLCELFGKSKSTISEHITAIFKDEELNKNSVVRNYRTTASDGKNYDVEYYNLDVIIALGFKVRSRSGVQFRKWANQILKEYIVKGFAMDDERLKNPPVANSKVPDYFEQMIERIRDIRASERRVYLRVKEIFALASDYDPSWSETTRFFQHIQNKLHFAVTKLTAAEIISQRADASRVNMGITTLDTNSIKSTDVTVAKNYLSEQEIDELNRIVVMWLDYAEDQAKRKQQVFLKDWEKKLDAFLEFNERDVLQNFGEISKKEADTKAKEEYKKFASQRREKREEQGLEESIKVLENTAKIIEEKK